MKNQQKTLLFEETPIPKAVATLAVPTVLSSLVMVLYNLADTYFVGMCNDPIQNAAVTLAAPVLLAFNAVNNLFGVGSSSMMSRALGCKDYETVYKSSAFGFYCALLSGVVFALLCGIFHEPLLYLLGADANTAAATGEYLKWTAVFGAVPSILNVVLAYMVRSEGSALHASIGTMSGCLLNIILDPVFILPWGLNLGAAGAGFATFLSNCGALLYFIVLLYKKEKRHLCVPPSGQIYAGKTYCHGCVQRWHYRHRSEPFECNGNDDSGIILLLLLEQMQWQLWELPRKSIRFPCRLPWGCLRGLCRLSVIIIPVEITNV